MYVDGASFDPNATGEDAFLEAAPPDCLAMPPSLLNVQAPTAAANGVEANVHLPNLSMEDLSSFHPDVSQKSAMAAEFQQQLRFDMEGQHQHGFDNNNHEHNVLMHDAFRIPDMDFNAHHHQQQFEHHQQAFNSSPELLNLFRLPRCSAFPLLPIHNSPISFDSPEAAAAAASTVASTVLYDPLLPLNLPPQPPVFRDLFQSLPHGYGGGFAAASPGTAGSLFGGTVDEGEGSGGGLVYGHDHGDGDGDFGGPFENGVLEFARGIGCNLGKGRKGNKGTKHFATEKQRRDHLNSKYAALGSLVPNPTKIDRASVVGDAIEYIRELLRTVSELKLLVAKKRCGRDRSKRHKTEDSTVTGDIESCNNMKPFGDPDRSSFNGPSPPLRSSWLLRKSKDTEVDVRIIEDEVTIKLVQRKRINCLLHVSKTLDELQLDLHHVAGGHIGDHYSFFFNTKIYEGSCVYASAIANKLIEVVDKQYAASVPPSSASF